MTDLSPTPRRIRTPRWIDFRLVLGVMLVFGAASVGALLFRRAEQTQPYMEVTRGLASGSTLTANDLKTVQVRLPAVAGSKYLADMDEAVGKTLTRPLDQGELVPRAAVTVEGTSTTVSLPLDSGAAPSLHVGQRVKAWLSTKTCQAVVLLADATVQAVDDGAGPLSGAGGGQNVVLSLAPPLADRVVAALALPDASVRVGTLTGAAQQHSNDDLPPLDPCQPVSAASAGTTS